MTESEIKEEPGKKGRSIWVKIGIFFSTIAIVILVIAYAYAYFELLRLNQQLLQVSAPSNHADALTEMQNKINVLQQSMQKSETLSSQQEQLLSEWKQAQAGDLSQWHVVQAEYLVRMANDQLFFAHQVQTALQLLQAADKELQFSQNPVLLNIRKSIATDLANLQALPSVDVTAIFLRLNAMHDVIDKLPLPIQPLKAEQTSSSHQASTWKAGLQSAVDALNKIVIIRKNDASALPLVMPDEKIFLYQNLHAQVDQAAWGLLHENPAIYVSSLARAISWIQQYFVQDAAETKSMLQQLMELQKINVQPASVTLSTTCNCLSMQKQGREFHETFNHYFIIAHRICLAGITCHSSSGIFADCLSTLDDTNAALVCLHQFSPVFRLVLFCD